MIPTALKSILPELQRKRFAGVNTNRLISYARMYVALHHIHATDEVYGDRKTCLSKLYDIFDELSRTYDRQRDIARRGEMLWTMFYCLHGTVSVPDRKRENRCYALADSLIGDYLNRLQTARHNPDEQFQVMRILFLCLYGVVEEENETETAEAVAGETDPWLDFVKQTLSAWVEELDGRTQWKNISDTEALQRLLLMNMNAYMLLDHQFDAIAGKLYTSYCHQKVLPGAGGIFDEPTLRQLYLLYELSLSTSITVSGRPLADSIADIFAQQYDLQPPGSELSALCMSIATENACDRISNALSHEAY